ncbi:MAG: DUF1573 domain-containing protein, partial [Pirellula sp.]
KAYAVLCSLFSVLCSLNASQTSDEPPKRPNESLPLLKITTDFNSADADVVCDLNELFTSTRYKIEIELKNKTDSTFETKSLYASCGCLAGLSKGIAVKPGETGTVVAVFTTPDNSEEFEKTISVVSVFGSELVLRLRGKSVLRVGIEKSSLIVHDRSDSADLFLDLKSVFGDKLCDLSWSAESSLPLEIKCTQRDAPNDFRVNMKLDLRTVNSSDPSTIVIVSAKSDDGLVFVKKSFPIYFAFNASTSPQRLVVKKQSDQYRGTIIVRKANYLPMEMEVGKKSIAIQSGDSRIPAEANVKRGGNGSFIVLVTIAADSNVEKIAESDFQTSFLILDLEQPDFRVPIIFQ